MKILLAATLLAAATQALDAAHDDPARYVDTFIGTLKGGHVFAGASRPFGSVKGELRAAPQHEHAVCPC